MNEINSHPLIKHKIMCSFSIGKGITDAELKKMAKKLNISENTTEFQEQLRKHIIRETQLAIYNNKIPGLITNHKVKKVENVKKPVKSSKKITEEDTKKRMKLALFATLIVQKILEQNLTSDEQCFLIVKLVSGLGLNDVDFRKYHGNSKNNEESDEDDTDESDEDLQ